MRWSLRNWLSITWLTTCVLTAITCNGYAQRLGRLIVTVTATSRDYIEAPTCAIIKLPANILRKGELPPVALRDFKNGTTVPAQLIRDGEQLKLIWLVRNLKRGQSRSYTIVRAKVAKSLAKQGMVTVTRSNGTMDIRIGDQLITSYHYNDAPKPYCYPLIGPTGKPVTRHFPMRTDVPGESTDHRHHRSMWFTFGDVNGVDFWSESSRAGRIVHRAFEALDSGRILARIRTRNDWIAPDGKRICQDVREVIVYRTKRGRLLDFNITLYAIDGDVKFGDTKEGMMGLRVASSMEVRRGEGHIVNARGNRDGNAWGKRAEWCDYYGPVDGDIVGIAIFDHPQNFRHPTYWHVRTYGLFAANPFGVRAFTRGGDGSYILREGSKLTFRYRIYIHEGDTETARVNDVYGEYADPPRVNVR